MDNVIALIMVVEWIAKDIHYNSTGMEFYALHLLADRISDFGSSIDDLKESYHLGYKNMTPPPVVDYFKIAEPIYEGIVADGGSSLQNALKCLCALVEAVGSAKCESDIPAGIHAILDGISQKALQYKFLVSASI